MNSDSDVQVTFGPARWQTYKRNETASLVNPFGGAA